MAGDGLSEMARRWKQRWRRPSRHFEGRRRTDRQRPAGRVSRTTLSATEERRQRSERLGGGRPSRIDAAEVRTETARGRVCVGHDVISRGFVAVQSRAEAATSCPARYF